jgi:ribosomal protein L11 methyltransferase
LTVLRDKKRKQSFLDIGTGSGILAIAAAKLGYRPIKAIDYASEAVRGAKRNALRNRVDNHFQIRLGDVNRLSLKATAKYDVLCANLFYDILITNAPRIVARVKLAGTLVLSGILDNQFDEVREVFEDQGMCLDRARKQREWRSGLFVFADR